MNIFKKILYLIFMYFGLAVTAAVYVITIWSIYIMIKHLTT